MGRGDGHGRDHGTVHGQGRMRLTRSGILWSSDRRGVGHFDSTRVKPNQVSSQVEATCVGSGKVWSMEFGLCSALEVWLSSWKPMTREMTRDMGETFFWWSEQADQATPMGRAELRAKTGTSRRRQWTAALTRRGPTVSIPTGPGLLKSSLASLVYLG